MLHYDTVLASDIVDHRGQFQETIGTMGHGHMISNCWVDIEEILGNHCPELWVAVTLKFTMTALLLRFYVSTPVNNNIAIVTT